MQRWRNRWILGAAGLLAVAAVALFTRADWWPRVSDWLNRDAAVATSNDTHADDDHDHSHDHADGHDDHGHDHAEVDNLGMHKHPGHKESEAIKLSAEARKSIGLTTVKIEPRRFEKTITIPGMVVERPGRSTVEVTAPLTGVITRIHIMEGEAVEPGQPLFEMRLTHEELVQLQSELLQIAEELDVIAREVKRLTEVTQEGVVAKKTLLERQYEQDKQTAALRAKQESLLLHGLSKEQVQKILTERTLLGSLTVMAPTPDDEVIMPVWQVQKLQVEKGQHVNAGGNLASLADHSELFIEGDAFERDMPHVQRLIQNAWPVSAVMDNNASEPALINDLKLLYVANEVDPQARTFHFYVILPNDRVRDVFNAGHRFVDWRFRPGQRLQVRVPIERLEGRIVLPLTALAHEGAETYVFKPNGNHFDRVPVRIDVRDQLWAVIADGGKLKVGDRVAYSGAQQLHLALKNRSGGGVDPHAGHNH